MPHSGTTNSVLHVPGHLDKVFMQVGLSRGSQGVTQNEEQQHRKAQTRLEDPLRVRNTLQPLWYAFSKERLPKLSLIRTINKGLCAAEFSSSNLDPLRQNTSTPHTIGSASSLNHTWGWLLKWQILHEHHRAMGREQHSFLCDPLGWMCSVEWGQPSPACCSSSSGKPFLFHRCSLLSFPYFLSHPEYQCRDSWSRKLLESGTVGLPCAPMNQSVPSWL